MERLIGQSLDRYRLDSVLGEGGMGAVFKAHDVTLERDVAVKVMHPHFARMSDFQERFLREARSAARLSHPGIIQVYDFGQARSHLYIVMEFIPGDDLHQILHDLKAANQWIVLPEAIELVRQISLALDYAHQQGVFHRDVKPANIMLKPEPSESLPYRPVITDLGLAKLAEDALMTQEGTSMGTPAYMSPEQASGEKVDARSDVYSLGILLYELAVGQLPFQVKTLTEAIRCHTKEPPPPPRSLRPDLPQPLEQVMLQALRKNPNDRFPSARTFAQALAALPGAPAPDKALPPPHEKVISLVTVQDEDEGMELRGPSIFDEFPRTPPDLKQDRVVVLARDRTSQTVSLTPQGLTIGRAADNDLVLSDQTVSRHHARLDFDGADYRIVDLNSTNGTRLGDVRVLPAVPQVWAPDKPLRIGDFWLRLERAHRETEPAAETFLSSEGMMVDATQIHARPGAGRVGLFLDTPALAIEPGSSTVAHLTVLNQGPLVDHFETTVLGIPTAWLEIATPIVRLLPGMHQEIQVIFRPPRSPLVHAGPHPLTFRVTSQDAPDEMAEIQATLTVAAFYQFDLDLRPRRQSGMTEASFQIQVSNQCNANLTIELTGRDAEGGCQYLFEPAQVVLPAGQDGPVQLTVRSSSPLLGEKARLIPFTITAVSAVAPELTQEVHGEWMQAPPAFEVTMRPLRQSGFAWGTFTLLVNNVGDSDLTVEFTAMDPEEGCQYTFQPPRLVVPAGQEHPVQLQVRPRARLPGAATKTYLFTVTARAAEALGVTRQVQGEWQQTPPRFELDLRPKRQSGVGRGIFAVAIHNQSDTDLTVHLEATDPEAGCQCTFQTPQMTVPAGQERSAELQVRSKAPLPGTTPKLFPFSVTAHPIQAPGVIRQVHGEWEQVPPTFEVALHPQKQSQAREGRFRVQIRNLSDGNLTMQLVAIDPEGRCLYTFDSSQMAVPSSGERSTGLQVRSKTRVRGEETRTHPFTITARPSEAPAVTREVQGQWEELPRRLAAPGVVAPLLLTIVGWAIAFIAGVILTEIIMSTSGQILFESLALATGYEIAEFGFPMLVGLIRGLITGAVGGLIMGIALSWAARAFRGKQVVALILGWAIVWGIARLASQLLVDTGWAESIVFWAIYGAAVGLVGGSLTGRALRQVQPSTKVSIVTTAWIIAWAASEALLTWLWLRGFDPLWPLVDFFGSLGIVDDPFLLTYTALLGLTAGTIGGLIMFLHLRQASSRQ